MSGGHLLDTDGPVEFAPRVWWVGSLLPGDDFQCHVYLIEQGDQSVLIDPGSALTADEVIRKINSVVGLDQVRWLVCSHCDPDIIGALPAMEAAGLHPEATIVTHWRDEALMRHGGSKLPYWRVEEHDWLLPLVDRTLRFVFTPYAHFAGAFNTFDETSRTLFSSDLFGGFGAEGELFATSLDYFDGVRAFHEHYMPSHEILVHAIDQLRTLPIDRIAPQHGKVVVGDLVTPMMDMLAGLECGIYLLAREDPGLRFLLATNQIIHDVIDTVVHEKDFAVVASRLDDLARDQPRRHQPRAVDAGRAGSTAIRSRRSVRRPSGQPTWSSDQSVGRIPTAARSPAHRDDALADVGSDRWGSGDDVRSPGDARRADHQDRRSDRFPGRGGAGARGRAPHRRARSPAPLRASHA